MPDLAMKPIVAQAQESKSEDVNWTMTPSTEAPSPEVEPQRGCDSGHNCIQEFGSPKNEAMWAALTQTKLGKAKFLRQVAEGEFCRSAQGLTQDQQKKDMAGNKIQCQLRKKIDTKQKLSRALWDNTTGAEDTIRYIGHSVFQLSRAHQATVKPLEIIEKCLELRRSRPLQENVCDIFQKALEDEKSSLCMAQKHLVERIEGSEVVLKDLELGKAMLRQDMHEKRHGRSPFPRVPEENRCGGDGGEIQGQLPRVQQWRHTQSKLSRPRSAGQPVTVVRKSDSEHDTPDQSHRIMPGCSLEKAHWQKDAEQLLADTNELCLVAQRVSVKNEEVLRARENDCQSARKHTLEAMRKRLLQTMELKKALERELRQTGEAKTTMETSRAETQRQCEQHKVSLDKQQKGFPNRRKIADGEPPQALEDKSSEAPQASEGKERPKDSKDPACVPATQSRKTQIQEALQDEYRRKTAVLQKLAEVREQLQEDLRCKLLALGIDMQCSKLLTRPLSANLQPSPPGTSQKPLFRRRHEREAGMTATFGPGSSGW